jgi:lipoprotein-anchoring transpeptidase ErfK/SrfK
MTSTNALRKQPKVHWCSGASVKRRYNLLFLICCLFVATAFGQPMSRDEVVALQITLDQAGFSCGQIDGKAGGLTAQALAAWQEANGLKPTGQFDKATALVFPAGGAVYTNYVITAEDAAQRVTITEDWLERSKLPGMYFQTLPEAVAEKFHAKEAFVQSLNAETNWTAGTVVKVPNTFSVKPRTGKAAKLKVSLAGKTIRAYDEHGKLIALFPCSIAAKQEKRPVGTLTVQTVALDPNYTYDPANFPELDAQQHSYGKLIVPPGPNNPVGTAWIGLSLPGYGMHGTPHPQDIGRTESHGCFRLANWNARRLAQMVEIGMPVEVTLD